MKKYLWLLSTAFLIQGCGNKEVFSPNKAGKETSVTSSALSAYQQCTQKTHIKAPVDVLVLVDNSSSTVVFDKDKKDQLARMIKSFALDDNFNYHIMVAPLVGSSSSSMLFANDTSTLDSSVANTVKPTSQISSINFPITPGGEYGISRAYDLIQANRSNGIFRSNSHTIVAILTNGNDTECTDVSHYKCELVDRARFYDSRINKLSCLGHNTSFGSNNCSGINSLNAETFRFVSLSIANSNSCSGTSGTFYHYASDGVFKSGLASRSYMDSYPLNGIYNDARDFCDSKADIFSHIRGLIKDVVLKHKYDRWPIASADANIDLQSIKVKVINANGTIRELSNMENNPSPTSGFKYDKNCVVSGSELCNTRISPTPGEPFTGHLVKLFGSDQVEFPECLSVEYYAPVEEYAYYYLPYGTPSNKDDIEFYVDGVQFFESSTNGWEFLGNKCQSDLSGKVFNIPTAGACGPILKLNGSAKIKTKQGASVSVRVDYISL